MEIHGPFFQPTVIIYKYATFICKHIGINIENSICTAARISVSHICEVETEYKCANVK